MSKKVYIPDGCDQPQSQIGATMESLASTIANRRDAGEESYTHRLIEGPSDKLLKKVMEEAGEVALAAKDADALIRTLEKHADLPEERLEKIVSSKERALDHLRYEAADVVYHVLVVLEKYGIDLDELAGELNTRMTEQERPRGGFCIVSDHVNRG